MPPDLPPAAQGEPPAPSPPAAVPPAVSIAQQIEHVEGAATLFPAHGASVLRAAAATLRDHEEAIAILTALEELDRAPLYRFDVEAGNALMDRAKALLASRTAPQSND